MEKPVDCIHSGIVFNCTEVLSSWNIGFPGMMVFKIHYSNMDITPLDWSWLRIGPSRYGGLPLLLPKCKQNMKPTCGVGGNVHKRPPAEVIENRGVSVFHYESTWPPRGGGGGAGGGEVLGKFLFTTALEKRLCVSFPFQDVAVMNDFAHSPDPGVIYTVIRGGLREDLLGFLVPHRAIPQRRITPADVKELIPRTWSLKQVPTVV